MRKVSEVLQALEAKEAKQLATAIRKIDRRLGTYDRSCPIKIHFDRSILPSVLAILIEKYSAAEMGWEVKGDSISPMLKFSEPNRLYPQYNVVPK